MKRLVATALTMGALALCTQAHAETLTDDQRKALLGADEANDAWLHEHCSFRGVTSPTVVNTDVPGQVVELIADGTQPLAKEFRCAERPLFRKGDWTPASADDVACNAPKPGQTCVAPLLRPAPPGASALPTAKGTPPMPPPAPPVSRALPPPSKPVASAGPVPVIGWVLVGTGIAGLATSGIAGGIVLDAKSTASAHCDRFNTCDADGLAAADRGRTAGLVGTIAFGVGAATLATGIVLLVVAKPREQQVSVVARPGGLSLEGSF